MQPSCDDSRKFSSAVGDEIFVSSGRGFSSNSTKLGSRGMKWQVLEKGLVFSSVLSGERTPGQIRSEGVKMGPISILNH